MGNLCGKPSKSDPFSSPGRVLGSAPASAPPGGNRRASVPARATKAQNHGQNEGRALGGASGAGGNVGSEDARGAAARAAEERAKKAQGDGKLGKQLGVQRQMTMNAALKQASSDNRNARDADEAREARNWN